MQRFAFGWADRDFQGSGGFEFGEELLFEGVFFFGESGDIDEVVAFVGVGLEVVEAVFIPEAVVVDILVSLGADGEESGGGREVPFPVVFVEDVVAPGFVGAFSIEEVFEGSSVHRGGVFGFRDSGEFEEGGGDVDVLNHLGELGAGFDAAGGVGEHRDADGVFEGIAFVVEAVLAEVETIVAEVEDDGIFGEAGGIEVVEDAADVFVKAVDGLAESPVEVIEGGDRVFVESAGFHVIDAVDAVSALANPVGLGGVVLLGVCHRFGVVNFFPLVAAVVTFGGLEGVVHGFEGEVHHERGVFFAAPLAFEPGEGLIGEAVGGVAFLCDLFSVDVEEGIEVGALALEADPVVESGAWVVVVMSHVPFSNHGGAVSRFLEIFGIEAGTFRDSALVIDDAVMVHVLARENGGAAGRAEGGCDEGVLDMGPLFRHAIEVRSFEEIG